ncbi:MAG: methionyl-tRNA formyltransferase [Candidatus Puniceispirillales bacterium]
MARIVFMGTPAFAVPSLEAMARDHEVAAVYSQPPRPSGRGMKTRPSAVHARAEDLGLAVETPLRLDAGAQENLAGYAPDFLIVVAYGLILPEPVLALPRKAAINGHASLLPRWRGAAPIHRAIAAGDTVTGVTAMLMAKSLDSGPMLATREEPIRDDDTTASLHDRLASLTATVLTEAVAGFDHLTPLDQNEADVTWAEKITPAEAEIDFTRPVAEIERRIRAFAPFPGAWFSIRRDDGNSQRIKVLAAEITSGQGQPGTVLGTAGTGPEIAAADGALVLTRVQPQGKPAMDGAAFLNGNTLPPQIIRSEQG